MRNAREAERRRQPSKRDTDRGGLGRITYRLGFMTNEQAFQFPEGTATTKFSGVSIPCP